MQVPNKFYLNSSAVGSYGVAEAHRRFLLASSLVWPRSDVGRCQCRYRRYALAKGEQAIELFPFRASLFHLAHSHALNPEVLSSTLGAVGGCARERKTFATSTAVWVSCNNLQK